MLQGKIISSKCYEASETTTAAATAPVKIEPDALMTPDYQMSDEEKSWRQHDHRRLNRKHKPVATPERIAELEARIQEVQAIFPLIDEADKAGDKEKVKELEEQTWRRGLRDYDQVVLRMSRRYGLLTDEDREALRAADAKRLRKLARRV